MSYAQLLREVHTTLREWVALEALAGELTQEDRKLILERLAFLDARSRRELHAELLSLQAEIRRRREFLGAIVNRGTLIELLNKSEEGPREHIIYLEKPWVDAHLKHYDRVASHWALLPTHARVGFDPGFFRTKGGVISVRVPEELAYLHLCALTNETLAHASALDLARASNRERTTLVALANSGTIAAFAFLESYLNGVAHDFVATQGPNLSADQRDQLLDWNSRVKRPRYLSLEEKVNKYQQIILGRPHAQIQPSNCPALARLLNEDKGRRDAIVHSGPSKEYRAFAPSMMRVQTTTTPEEVLAVGEAAIEVVEMLNRVFGGSLTKWMKLRRPNGMEGYPAEVFE